MADENEEITEEELAEQRKVYNKAVGDVKATKEMAIVDALDKIHYTAVQADKTRMTYIKEAYGFDVTDVDIDIVEKQYRKWASQQNSTDKNNKADITKRAYYNLLAEKNYKNKKEVVQEKRKAAGKQIAKYWENADKNKQIVRKRWNEEGKRKAQAKLAAARAKFNYFNSQIKKYNKLTTPYVKKGIYNPKTGTYDRLTTVTKAEYLKHCRAEALRWSKEMTAQKKHIANYQYGIEQSSVKIKVYEDAERANSSKRAIQTKNKVPQSTVNKANNPAMPKEVEEYGKTLGPDYKLTTLKDSKGNQIYRFDDKDGKPAQVMAQLKGQNPSKPMAVKSDGMKALLDEAKGLKDQKGADFTDVIGRINDQPTRDAINDGPKQEISALKIMATELTPKKPDKINRVATVSLVPHVKKSGKLSKLKSDIMLTDADGKSFVLTKKIVKQALKQKGNSSATRAEMADASWKNYLDAAKAGRLKPEVVASFFKDEKPNIPQSQQQMTAMQMKKQQGNTI